MTISLPVTIIPDHTAHSPELRDPTSVKLIVIVLGSGQRISFNTLFEALLVGIAMHTRMRC